MLDFSRIPQKKLVLYSLEKDHATKPDSPFEGIQSTAKTHEIIIITRDSDGNNYFQCIFPNEVAVGSVQQRETDHY
ncbi:MAG: hypothetical protein HC877_17575 [Thioploca sp.]|nr:hypothetical protein [Thioploca sp.]